MNPETAAISVTRTKCVVRCTLSTPAAALVDHGRTTHRAGRPASVAAREDTSWLRRVPLRDLASGMEQIIPNNA